MAAIKSKNTKPEIFVRKTLHALGYRYRLHSKNVPGKPDMYLAKWKLAVFVNGCFWHGHQQCPLYRLPKTREEFWASKVAANVARDKIVRDWLAANGLRYLDVWECALKGKSSISPETVRNLLGLAIRSLEIRHEIRGSPIPINR
jgi:DNA mismatch endonuclease (patch repair protein)